MTIIARVKSSGSVFLGFAIMIGMMAIGIGLLTGAAVFSIWILKWTFPAITITLILAVVALLPLSLIPATRGIAAIGFLIASLIFGAILWLWGMGYTYSVWGLFAVIVGLLFFGVGVVPIAMFAALVHGDWGNLGMFAFAGVVTIGFRMLANWLAKKADERAFHLSRSENTVQAYIIPD